MRMNKHAENKKMSFLQFILILHIFVNIHDIYLNDMED